MIPDEGKIVFEDKEFIEMTPQISRNLGIEVVYQEYKFNRPLVCSLKISVLGRSMEDLLTGR